MSWRKRIGHRTRSGVLLAGAATLVCPFLLGCKIGYPFRGPGYDSSRGVTHPQAGTQVVVAITQGDIQSSRGGDFSGELQSVLSTMHQHDGLIGYAARKEIFGSRVWTMSVWIDRESMQRFARSPAHQQAVTHGGIDPASFISTITLIEAREVPLSWSDAEGLLEEQADRE